MTSQKPKKFISVLVVLTMVLALLPASLGLAASYDSIGEFVKNVYEVGLGREADVDGYNYWVSELEAGTTTAAQFVGFVLLDSAEFNEKYADISNEEFVEKAYEIIFNREADEEGAAFWADSMKRGGSQKYVLVAMMYAPTGEFQEFCDAVGVKLGNIRLAETEFPGDEPVELEVVDVSAINLKQIMVEFNSASLLDEDAAGDVDNYELEDSDDDIALSDADVEGNVVILSIEDGSEVDNQSEATLTISDEVLDDDEEFDIEFFDMTIPSVLGAEVVGSDTVKIYFSEPIKEAEKDDFSIDDGDYFIKEVELLENNTVVNVTTYSDFDEGTIDVTIDNSIEDFAGFNVISKTLTVDVDEDEDAPEIIGYEDASTDGVTLIFNEDIIIDDEDENNFYHTNDNNPAITFELVDGNKIELVFADTDDETEDVPLPEGYAYVYVKGDTIVDLWGNVAENTLSIRIEVTEDTEAPEVDDVDATESEIEITFTENVDVDSAEEEDNYTIIDSDGDEVEDIVDDATADDDVVTLELDDDLDYGTYKLVIEDVEDKSGNKMEKTTVEFTVDDDEAPDYPATEDVILYTLDEDGNYKEYKIVIDYDEAMSIDGKYSVLDADNYSLVIDDEDYVLDKLDDYFDDVEVSIKATDSNKIVEILIEVDDDDFELVADRDGIIIARIADAAGNYTSALSSGVIGFTDGEDKYIGFTAEATATDEITIEFDSDLDDFDGNDLKVVYKTTVTIDGEDKTLEQLIAEYKAAEEEDAKEDALDDLLEYIDDYDITVGKADVTADDEVVLELDEELGYDAKYGEKDVCVIVVDDDSVNRYDETLELYDLVAVVDEIAPAVDTDKVFAEGNVIQIPFEEAIDPDWISIATFEVEDNTVEDVFLNEDNDVVYLIMEDEVEENDDIDQIAPIYDENDNKVTGLSFDVEEGSFASAATVSGQFNTFVVDAYDGALDTTTEGEAVFDLAEVTDEFLDSQAQNQAPSSGNEGTVWADLTLEVPTDATDAIAFQDGQETYIGDENNGYVIYVAVGKAVEESGTTTYEAYSEDQTYEYTIVWKNANDNVIAVQTLVVKVEMPD